MPDPPAPQQPPPSAPPLLKQIPESPNVPNTLPATPSTPSDMGTLRSTSSVKSHHGPGCLHKELSMSTLADCPPNASKEELSKWWKQKESEFWRYKKLSGPKADEY